MCSRFWSRYPFGANFDELGVPTRYEHAVHFVDGVLPLVARVGANEELLVHEGELGGPVGRQGGRGADGEVDVGGDGGICGEEVGFDVDPVELDGFGEASAGITEPCTW